MHRIGRTARAGASGDAISFACEDFSFSLPDIEEYIGHSIASSPISADLLAQDLKAPERIERYGRGRGDHQRGERQRGDRQGRGKDERSRDRTRGDRGEQRRPRKEEQESRPAPKNQDQGSPKPQPESPSSAPRRRSPHNEKPAIG